MNSVRLWMPQIFATMHAMEMQGANDTSMCAVLDHNADDKSLNTDEKQEECNLVGRISLATGFTGAKVMNRPNSTTIRTAIWVISLFRASAWSATCSSFRCCGSAWWRITYSVSSIFRV